MADQILESLIEQVLRPLSGEVGEDLAQTSSMELIQIRNQFNDSNRDFRLLYETGRVILSEKSKDLWAAWALAGGLLWSKQFESAEGFVASSQIVRQLCERYWAKLYPESRGLKSTLLSQIAKWWNTFVERCTEGADKDLLKAGRDEVSALHQFLLSVTDGNTDQDKARVLPVLQTLPVIVRRLNTVVNPGGTSAETSAAATTGQAPPARAESSSTPAAGTTEPASSRVSEGLDQAFAKACDRIRAGAVEDALNDFQANLVTFAEFANQFRGRVMLGELYLRAGLPTHAKRVLQYTHDEIDKIRLPEWDPKLCSRLWSNLIQAHQKCAKDEKADEKLLGTLFANLCRIDPAKAVSLEPIKGGS
jgi:hypothetical protein